MSERFLTRQAIFVICRNDKNEVLLERRENTGYLDGYWDFPSGHVETGEGLREAAIRELKEETDLDSLIEDMKLVHIEQFFVDEDYVNYTFHVRKFTGQPKIMEPDKCGDLEWFAIDDLPTKCVNNVRANEAAGFSDELTYSVTRRDNYQELLEEK